MENLSLIKARSTGAFSTLERWSGWLQNCQTQDRKPGKEPVRAAEEDLDAQSNIQGGAHNGSASLTLATLAEQDPRTPSPFAL